MLGETLHILSAVCGLSATLCKNHQTESHETEIQFHEQSRESQNMVRVQIKERV